MQERVAPMNEDFAEIVIQYGSGHMSVGLGLEPRTVIKDLHYIDAIYGPHETEIGKIFAKRMNELGWDSPDFQDSDSEAIWHDKVGRAVLDAVTGSTTNDGLWTWLDRPATNRMIRLLRKARDASFGRDE